MLVLSRKPGERIFIGEDVKVTIIRIGPNSVRVGIEAPGHMNIVREELCLDGNKLDEPVGAASHADSPRGVLPR